MHEPPTLTLRLALVQAHATFSSQCREQARDARPPEANRVKGREKLSRLSDDAVRARRSRCNEEEGHWLAIYDSGERRGCNERQAGCERCRADLLRRDEEEAVAVERARGADDGRGVCEGRQRLRNDDRIGRS